MIRSTTTLTLQIDDDPDSRFHADNVDTLIRTHQKSLYDRPNLIFSASIFLA